MSADSAATPRLSDLAHDTGGGFSPGRVYAMLLRYLYLLRSSWPRALELIYWPTIQMVLWGFMSQFLRTNSSWVASAFGVLIAAVLLWDVLFRSQLGVSMSFLEEMWARNLGHLFVSPLRPYEWVLSLLAMSVIRVMIGVVPAMLLAIPLYHYSIFTLGLPFIAFFLNLMIMGWALGLMITALILRHGLGAESIAWLAIFVLAPVSAVYYPVTVLPIWLQDIAMALPSVHVFEGMRAVMFDHVFRLDHFFAATALNGVYITLGGVAFLYSFRNARRRGALLQVGE
jgi:ABC-2 type transport system permease protein